MIEYWTFSLFYCAAELWGSVVISVLFWSLANEVCTVNEAKVCGAAGVLAALKQCGVRLWDEGCGSECWPAAGREAASCRCPRDDRLAVITRLLARSRRRSTR